MKILAAIGITVVVPCLFVGIADGAREEKEILITSFEEANELGKLVFYHAEGRIVSDFPSEGEYSLKVEFKSEYDWPQFQLLPEKLGFTKDWSKFNTILFDVYNPEERGVRFGIRIDDPILIKGAHPAYRQAHFTIPAKSKKTFGFNAEISELDPKLLDRIIGRPPQPLPKGIQPPVWEQSPTTKFNITQIERVTIYIPMPQVSRRDYTLYFDNFRLIHAPPIGLEKIVDRFGQYNYADWKGKVYSEEDLCFVE